MKKCTRCKIFKEEKYFYKDKSRGSGLSASCAACISEYRKLHYVENKEETLKKNETWKSTNKIKYRESERNRENERYKSDPIFKLKKSLRKRLNSAIRNNQKTGSAVDDLGCTIEELKLHLESLFQSGMGWGNWGLGKGKWELDHKVPLLKFDLMDREQFLIANNYANLQPLWYEDHKTKTQNDLKVD